MDQKELLEQINKTLTDNPGKIIKVRDTFDEMFAGRSINSAQAIGDKEYERIRSHFRDMGLPLSWCTDKTTLFQLYKAINQRRDRDRHDAFTSTKKSSKPKKKGLFGFLN